ncbi:cation transporter [Corynebacterium breve]|uniref:Cation transporter n=1 Tax=Corynebacterium breve TaxID=3049799 RepID=A0ABY8VG02_9CORY|nr:cation transporter [Corynebacterium breve]WIM68428.1 cation transporter [Corynebacterium breve]
MDKTHKIRRVVLIVALLNLAYFFVEFGVAVGIGSVSLFADSVDFLEDTAVNFLVFFAMTWTVTRRRRVGAFLSVVIMVPAIAALATAIYKMFNPSVPEPLTLTATAVGALIVNVVCAALLSQLRHMGTSLTSAAWLAARNDVISNILIIGAGVASMFVPSAWFDILVGLLIAAINFTAAKEVWEQARLEPESIEEALEAAEDDD